MIVKVQAGDGSYEEEGKREAEELVRKEEKEENDLLLRNFKQEVAELRRQVRHLEVKCRGTKILCPRLAATSPESDQ